MNRCRLKLLKIIVVLLISMILVGCWDNYELDTVSIVTGMGIDASDNDDEIDLILHAGKVVGRVGYESESMPEGKPFMIMEATDKGIVPAIDKLKRQSTRSILLHHSEVIVFGKEELEKGIKEHIDFFLRENQMRMDTWVLTSDGKAKDILTSDIEQEQNSAIGLSKMIDSSSRNFQTFSVRLIDLTSAILAETTAPVIPIVNLKNEEDSSRFEVVGLAILKDEKYIGKLDEKKLQGYSWIMGNCVETMLDVNLEHGYANMKISNIKFDSKPKVNENGPFISIDLKGDISFDEIRDFEGVASDEVFKILEKAGEDKIKEEIMDCFEYSQNLNADIYGFGQDFHKKYPKHWKQLKKHWDEIFPELEMAINVDLKTMDTGKIMNSLEMGED